MATQMLQPKRAGVPILTLLHPREHTAWEDCVNGANVLLHAALALSRQ